MKLTINGIDIDWHRCPIRLELVNHVVPISLFLTFLGVLFGYFWRGMQG